MPDGEITLGELSRNIKEYKESNRQEIRALEGRMTNQYVELNRRLDSLQFVNRETYDVQMKNLTDRIEDLEESKKWLARSLAFSFLIAFLAPVAVAVVVTR